MKLRFDRDYELIIEFGGQRFEIRPPMHITFDGVQSIAGDLNRLNIQIYNLNEDKRRSLIKDPEDQEYFPLIFSVGYKGNLVRKFSGSVQTASSIRQGSNFITKITCLDGGYDYQYSHTSAAVTSMEEAFNTMIGTFEHTNKGKVSVSSKLTRPVVMVGNTVEIMKKHLKDDENLFFKDGKIHIINNGQCIGEFISVVSPETGLKSTPERKNKITSFTTIMNPTISLGGRIDLKSTTAVHLNGIYRVDTNSFKGDYRGADWDDVFECIPAAGIEVL